MATELLNQALVLAGVVVYAAVVYALYVSLRNSSFTRPVGTGAGGAGTADGDYHAVRCRSCGAENDAAYRFCANCATDLDD